jgi:5-methyltetrahydropteroyltriglutamate--homocysteine methyltransferase
MVKKIETTVIGSYPVEINNLDFFKDFYNKKPPSWDDYIETAVYDMVDAGVDIVSDGQTRDPFVNIFLRKMKGVRVRNRPEIVDNIEFKEPITVDDIEYVKNIIPSDTKIVGLLAGPFTLMKSCVDLFYNDEKQICFDIAKVLQKEAEVLQDYVDLISCDEPFFSVSFPEYGQELINLVFEKVEVKKRLHVCGDVTSIIPGLLDMPVDVLSHEFKAQTYLIDEFKDYSVDKEICLGCVRSDDAKVEDVSEIENHINKAIDVFDDKVTQISPDCGLRHLSRENAFKKLRNLVIAGESVNG